MVKSITWFRRKPGTSVEEFRSYWQNEHAEKVVKVPGLRRYVQNPAIDWCYENDREPFVDGVAETWFDDTDAMRAVASSDAYRDVLEDEAHFLEPSSRTELICDERVIKGSQRAFPVGALKYISFIRRKPDMGVADFQRYWREHHGPLAARNPYLLRYVQNHVRPRFYETGRVPPFDGVPETWFATFDDLRASARTEELRLTREDEVHFMADPGGQLPYVIAHELEIELVQS